MTDKRPKHLQEKIKYFQNSKYYVESWMNGYEKVDLNIECIINLLFKSIERNFKAYAAVIYRSHFTGTNTFNDVKMMFISAAIKFRPPSSSKADASYAMALTTTCLMAYSGS
jgi:hypothetical protein